MTELRCKPDVPYTPYGKIKVSVIIPEPFRNRLLHSSMRLNDPGEVLGWLLDSPHTISLCKELQEKSRINFPCPGFFRDLQNQIYRDKQETLEGTFVSMAKGLTSLSPRYYDKFGEAGGDLLEDFNLMSIQALNNYMPRIYEVLDRLKAPACDPEFAKAGEEIVKQIENEIKRQLPNSDKSVIYLYVDLEPGNTRRSIISLSGNKAKASWKTMLPGRRDKERYANAEEAQRKAPDVYENFIKPFVELAKLLNIPLNSQWEVVPVNPESMAFLLTDQSERRMFREMFIDSSD